jgi:hypothetical protein
VDEKFEDAKGGKSEMVKRRKTDNAMTNRKKDFHTSFLQSVIQIGKVVSEERVEI